MPEPEPTAGTVKVKVGFNGICGTDLHEYYAGPIFIPTEPHPLTGQTLPLTIGQEFSGVITGVGAGVTGYSEGDRVAMPRSTRPGWRPRYRPLAGVGARGTGSAGQSRRPQAHDQCGHLRETDGHAFAEPRDERIQGARPLCYTSADFEAVIALMAQGGYDTTGWVKPISIDDVVDEGFEALHAGAKMKVLVDPTS